MALLAPSLPAGVLRGDGPGEVDEVLAWESADLAPVFSGSPLPDRLRNFDSAFVYSRDDQLARALAPHVAQVRRRDPLPPPGSGHAAAWLAGLVADDPVEPPSLHPTPEELERAHAWLTRLPPGFLALHPGSGAAAKNWPTDRFARLARALSPDAPWLLVAGPADSEASRTLAAEPGALLADRLPLRVLGALLSRAGLYVGNDSGVSNLAAAYAAPTIALFGPTDPEVWRPLGPSVRVVHAPGGRIADLAFDLVLDAARGASRRPSLPAETVT